MVKVILCSLLDALTDRMPGRRGVELHFCGDGADITRGSAAAGEEAGARRVIAVTDGTCLELERLSFGGDAERDDSGVIGLKFDVGRLGEIL